MGGRELHPVSTTSNTSMIGQLKLNAHHTSLHSKEDSLRESRTWPELKRLATDVPEAGIHFQSKTTPPQYFHTSPF